MKNIIIIYLMLLLAPTSYSNTPIWQIGMQDNSSAEFSDYATIVSVDAATISAASFPKGLNRSVDADIEITYNLSTLPANGVLFSFKLLHAHNIIPQMAIFSNGMMAGMIQLYGTANTGFSGKWKKTYQLYIPPELLQTGTNTIRFESERIWWYGPEHDNKLWWEWDYVKLESLAFPATEPVHGSVTYIGGVSKKSENGFGVDQGLINSSEVAFKWMGIAYSGSPVRASYWSNITSSTQPMRREFLELLKSFRMTAVLDRLTTKNSADDPTPWIDASGNLKQAKKDIIDAAFTSWGNLIQFYELDNEPCQPITNAHIDVDKAIARYIQATKPGHLKLTAPGYSFNGNKGFPINWSLDKNLQREVDGLCDLLGGHAYNASYGNASRGSFNENLKAYPVNDGWPKPFIVTEMGNNNGHTDEYASAQPTASSFDKIMRAHVSVADYFMQFNLFNSFFAIFDQPSFLDGTAMTAKPMPNGQETRLSIYRRIAYAYGTHGKPLPFTIDNQTALQNKKVYFRAVDPSALEPLAGRNATTQMVLLNFVNFENSTQTITVTVTLPQGGTFSSEKFKAGDTFTQASANVNIVANPNVTITETLGPMESVQYIVPAGGGWNGNYTPVASFNVNVEEGEVPLTVDFDASSSSDQNPGDALTYSWDFGDGTTGSGITPSHTYTAPGIYFPVLTVTDPSGASDTRGTSITVLPDQSYPPGAIGASDDAYVRDGNFAASNFGKSTSLVVKNGGTAGFRRMSFLKFDLTGITGSVNEAKLRLYPTKDATHLVQLDFVNDDLWFEDSINWNNKPAPGIMLSQISGITGDVPLEIDITGQVVSELNGDKFISLRLYTFDTLNTNTVNFGSEERVMEPEKRPMLLINQSNTQNLSADADSYINKKNKSTNFGSDPTLGLKGTSTLARKAYIRFDVSASTGFVNNASVILTLADVPVSTTFKVYGLNDGDPGENWGEQTIDWNNAPANSAQDAQQFDAANSTLLGSFSIDSTEPVGTEKTFSSQALLDFLNADTDGKVTVMIATTSTAAQVQYFSSKENTTYPGPRLLLTTTPTFTRDLNPADDAYIREAHSTNFSSAVSLNTKNASTTSFDRKIYVKFDMSAEGYSSGNIIEAKLRLYCNSNDFSAADVVVYHVTNDNWSESTITGNDNPSFGNLENTTTVSAIGQYYEWDVTSVVKSEADGDDIVSLGLFKLATGGQFIKFDSKEGPNQPILQITAVGQAPGANARKMAPQSKIESTDFDPGMLIYPNPAHDDVSMIYTAGKNGEATIKVLNLAGVVVENIKMVLAKGINRITIPVGRLPDGLYVVSISSVDGVSQRKILIKR